MLDFVKDYVAELRELLGTVDPEKVTEAIEILRTARDTGQRVFAVGNGGSASAASHFVNDLGKGASYGRDVRFKVIPLTDNVEWMTALSNDVCYEDVFVEQLRNHAEPGDVLVALSGSGNSENVLRAVRYANEIGCHTIGISGFEGGGKLGGLAKLPIIIESGHMGRIEDLHLILLHIVAYYFMEFELKQQG